jgi:ABC-type transport system substrate-binding protein
VRSDPDSPGWFSDQKGTQSQWLAACLLLDPTLARTYVGRIVFASLCDKLFDIDQHLNLVPQLALGTDSSDDGRSVTIKLRRGVTFTMARRWTLRP